jgi:hypothetical protein
MFLISVPGAVIGAPAATGCGVIALARLVTISVAPCSSEGVDGTSVAEGGEEEECGSEAERGIALGRRVGACVKLLVWGWARCCEFVSVDGNAIGCSPRGGCGSACGLTGVSLRLGFVHNDGGTEILIGLVSTSALLDPNLKALAAADLLPERPCP